MTYTDIDSALHSQYDFDGTLEHFQHALQNPNRNYIGGVFYEQINMSKNFLFDRSIYYLFIHY
jgi:hypothetical protein